MSNFLNINISKCFSSACVLRTRVVFLQALMCHCFIAGGWLWSPRRSNRWFLWHPRRTEGTFPMCSAHPHLAGPAQSRWSSCCIWWNCSVGWCIHKDGVCIKARLCGESISCPTHEVSQWAVHTWAHTASFPSHAHKLCGKLFSELWHILMSLGSFFWGLTTAILSERFSTKLRDNFH